MDNLLIKLYDGGKDKSSLNSVHRAPGTTTIVLIYFACYRILLCGAAMGQFLGQPLLSWHNNFGVDISIDRDLMPALVSFLNYGVIIRAYTLYGLLQPLQEV